MSTLNSVSHVNDKSVEKEIEDKKNELIETITIERIAEILYYCLYAPDKHPNGHLYEKIEDWYQIEMPEMAFLSALELMVLLAEKLEKAGHPKFVFFRNWIDYALSPYFNERLPKSINTWFCRAYYLLSKDSSAYLRPFPLSEWYEIDGSYSGIYLRKPGNRYYG